MTEVRMLLPILDVALRRATLISIGANAVARVLFQDGVPDEVECDVLQVTDEPLRLAPGDRVLAWCPVVGERGVVLGRIGPTCSVDAPSASEKPAEEIVLEARRSLTLRVGDGSITIRADGKILIKGKDLVSHAQRTNRIKGGSVAIN